MALPLTFIDELPYTSQAMPYTHPQHLATIGQIFGMQAAQPRRILELACGDGSNILGIAQSMPKTECWAIDKSETKIVQAQKVADKAKLHNVTLKAMDILEVDSSLGQFDYIIVHGIYSWGSAEVKQKILQLCKQLLSEKGIAYVSYDTTPAGDSRRIVRQMLRYHSMGMKDSQQRLDQLHALFKFLIAANRETNTAYSLMLQEEYQIFQQLPHPELYLDYIDADNEPVLFTEFMQRAHDQELDYLGDAFFKTMLPQNLSADVQQNLAAFEQNILQQEQYMDFARNRRYRHTLLVHKDITLERNLDVSLLKDFYLCCDFQVKQVEDAIHFVGTHGTVTTENPAAQKVFTYLGQQYPRFVKVDELLENTGTQSEAQTIFETLFSCCMQGVIELHHESAPYTAEINEQPFASPLARAQAELGLTRVTNLRNEPVDISSNVICLHLLPYLDGQHNQSDLKRLIQYGIDQKKYRLDVNRDGQQVELSEEQKQDLFQRVLNNSLHLLAHAALILS
ncbi:class I SAM-dependent methyltransferase [Candidatus Albibeggiatoa sp. nov. NOAA]|uniref:class I SAM-dependent methyltransferase n=1 Tax=Candidatus Albibeggiatoa sp. nov. NOAA TaxID=3162724 RepID=UPI0032F17EA7|nr:class I SAM-dependent methyltransferase [Thiotrichaceae bacterium]